MPLRRGARGFAMRLKIGSLKIKGRLHLVIGLMAFGCVVMTVAMIWLQERSVFAGRARELEALVDTAIAVLDEHHKLTQSGVMPEAEAEKRAIAIVGGLHYHNNSDYF